jgi:hypothetical protein
MGYLVGKSERKRQLRRKRSRCVKNIEMNLRDTGHDVMDRIDLALVNTVMNLRIPQNFREVLSRCITGGFSRRARLYLCVS